MSEEKAMPAEGRQNERKEKEKAMARGYETARGRRKKRRRRNAMIKRILLILILLVLIVGVAYAVVKIIGGGKKTEDNSVSFSAAESGASSAVDESTDAAETTAAGEEKTSVMEQADLMAAGYDYDSAIALLQTIPGYESDADITAAIQNYEATKATCVAVDVDKVPHIFYHSLVNDPSKAFSEEVMGSQAAGFNAWMTTVEEFDKITQQMYDNGYVFVRLRDLVVETTDEDGNVHFEKNTNLMLPPDKKAVVLSVDDLSYYHAYEAASYPDKLVLDENGNVKCHYVDASGNESVGDYDVVPRLNTFLNEHPDGAYKGARGLIALTGYNGVFGYRTDIDYKVKEHLQDNQKAWLDAHPDFNYEQDIEDAKVIAQALKDEGWEFASHTWGHLSVTQKTAEQLEVDNEKWVNTVQNIVGPVDTIIFAHGNDIGTWQDYTMDNDKYAYYKSVGYNFFCNVDGSQEYWVQIRDQYVRQGRINLDGYSLYKATQGGMEFLKKMFDPMDVFDTRRPTPVVANGQG